MKTHEIQRRFTSSPLLRWQPSFHRPAPLVRPRWNFSLTWRPLGGLRWLLFAAWVLLGAFLRSCIGVTSIFNGFLFDLGWLRGTKIAEKVLQFVFRSAKHDFLEKSLPKPDFLDEPLPKHAFLEAFFTKLDFLTDFCQCLLLSRNPYQRLICYVFAMRDASWLSRPVPAHARPIA